MFGETLKKLRSEQRMTLREFSRIASEDPANLSRIERELRLPPNDEVIGRYAKALKLSPETSKWTEFFDLATVSRGELPKDIASDKDLACKLPAMLRTIRGGKPDEEHLEEVLNVTRKTFR